MASVVSEFDRLPSGTTYNKPDAPSTDSAPDKINGADVLPMDSLNPRETMQVMSIATEANDGPTNPAPYWNSGEQEIIHILD